MLSAPAMPLAPYTPARYPNFRLCRPILMPLRVTMASIQAGPPSKSVLLAPLILTYIPTIYAPKPE